MKPAGRPSRGRTCRKCGVFQPRDQYPETAARGSWVCVSCVPVDERAGDAAEFLAEQAKLRELDQRDAQADQRVLERLRANVEEVFAAGANADHGLRRTNADKRRAVEALLSRKEWAAKSDRWVAKAARVGHQTVGRIRSELVHGPVGGDTPEVATLPPEPPTRTGQDGKARKQPARVWVSAEGRDRYVFAESRGIVMRSGPMPERAARVAAQRLNATLAGPRPHLDSQARHGVRFCQSSLIPRGASTASTGSNPGASTERGSA